MVEVRCTGLLQLSRGARESRQSPKLSEAGDPPLDARASAPRPEAPAHLAPPCCSWSCLPRLTLICCESTACLISASTIWLEVGTAFNVDPLVRVILREV